MATHDGTARLLHRVTRDLAAPMALLASIDPHRRVVAHAGFESGQLLTELLSVETDQERATGTGRAERPDFLSWAAAIVHLDEIEVGTLLVADRRRRWFDDEELRHLGLLSFSAGPIIAAMSAPIDVRDQRLAEVSFA